MGSCSALLVTALYVFLAFHCNDASLWILAIDDDCWSYEMMYMHIEVIVHIDITYVLGWFSADTPTDNKLICLTWLCYVPCRVAKTKYGFSQDRPSLIYNSLPLIRVL